MRTFVIVPLLIVASYAATNEPVAKLIASGNDAAGNCQEEIGTTVEEISKLRTFEVPTTKTGKCFVACILKKLDFMTVDGKLKKENGYNFIEQIKEIDEDLYIKMKKVADACYAEVEESPDHCETATNLHICVEKEKKINGVPRWEL